MTLLLRLLALADRVSSPRTAYAHCDLPCGVYDPVQAKVEADSVKAIIEKYNGGPVGLNTLAATLAEEEDALEEVYEPFLIQIGFLDRTPRGRVATRLAYQHFGLPMPHRQTPLF